MFLFMLYINPSRFILLLYSIYIVFQLIFRVLPYMDLGHYIILMDSFNISPYNVGGDGPSNGSGGGNWFEGDPRPDKGKGVLLSEYSISDKEKEQLEGLDSSKRDKGKSKLVEQDFLDLNWKPVNDGSAELSSLNASQEILEKGSADSLHRSRSGSPFSKPGSSTWRAEHEAYYGSANRFPLPSSGPSAWKDEFESSFASAKRSSSPLYNPGPSDWKAEFESSFASVKRVASDSDLSVMPDKRFKKG